MLKEDITFLGETTFRNERKKFGIKTDDRRRHLYIIGKTGMGKTSLIENMVFQDIQKGHGVGVIDPHGEFAEKMLDCVPENRTNDVIYFNPADLDYPIAFNIMEKVEPEYRHLVAAGLMGVFKKIWPDVWSARMEYILNNCILALLEYPGATLLSINRMLANKEYREKVIEQIKDPIVKSFWLVEYAGYTQRYEIEAKAAIQNKIGQFISTPLIRNIVGQVKTTINMRRIMDKKQILIVNLSKGLLGEDNSKLLGGLLITKLQLAAMSRVDVPEEKRPDFFLYVDEFQNFATESFANILSEARKYRLSLILAHQYIAQMEEKVRDAVFGNVGTTITFRVGADDAEYLEREFSPVFTTQDIVNLGKYNIYVKLLIDGVSSRPFSAATLPPVVVLQKSNRDEIIKNSRQKYTTFRKTVEENISRWSEIEKVREFSAPPNPLTLYDARCSLCGKETKVIFPPDPKRPVYCRACLKRPEKENGKESSFISLEDATKKEPVSFSKERKEIPKEKRKEVDLEGLKKAIEESLEKKEPENKKRRINPGEVIKF